MLHIHTCEMPACLNCDQNLCWIMYLFNSLCVASMRTVFVLFARVIN